MWEIKMLEGAVLLLLASAICTRSSPAVWRGRNSSAEAQKAASQRAAELGNASRTKGEKVCTGIFFVS